MQILAPFASVFSRLWVTILLFGPLSACQDTNPVAGGEGNVVRHELHADIHDQDHFAISAWNNILHRIQSSTEITAAIPAWRDTATLFSLVRRVRQFDEPPSLSLIQDPDSFSVLPQSLRDSFDVWQQSGLLKSILPNSDTLGRMNERVIIFKKLLDISGGHKSQSAVHLFQNGNGQRLMLFVHDDTGWCEAIGGRLKHWVENENTSLQVSTQITTDQYVQGAYFYPVNFHHSLMDTLLSQLEYGLQTLHRPARIRICNTQEVAPSVVHQLNYLVEAFDLDLEIITSRGMGKSFQVSKDAGITEMIEGQWLPDMVVLDGDFGVAVSEIPPKRKQIVLLGSVPLLSAAREGAAGFVLLLQKEEVFFKAMDIWERYFLLAQAKGQHVDYVGGSYKHVY